MEKQETLLVKYRALVSEWNAISLTCSILFGFSLLGLVLGFIYYNSYAIAVTLLVMIVAGIFEYRSRKDYIQSRTILEDEIFKLAKIKRPGIKELIKKGLWW